MRIDRDHLLETAAQRSGRTDFGPPDFAPGLDALIAALGEDRVLGEDARESVTERLLAPLVQRAQLYGDRTLYPEIAAQRIEKPLIVIGLPRSGTTFLHALLAQDPAARGLLPWQITQPSPPPRRETIDTDPRIAATDAVMAKIPVEYQRLHMIGTKMPDECNAVTQMAFCSTNLIARFDVPAYQDWYMANDARAAYRLHHDLLQHLQAFTDGGHWVLKSPPHMLHMATLIAAYPNARIVFPHRDPAQALPSFISLITFLKQQLYPDIDRKEIGRQALVMWGEAIDRMLAFRSDPAQAERFADVSYRKLIADPIGEARRIYATFGMAFTPAVEAAMRRFLARQPKDKHGAHRYAAEDAGLTRTAIEDRFAAYIDRHLTEDAVPD